MSEINCNVIKDLLPSYIEDICSDDSKKLVEEHLAECGECRNLEDMMRRMEITSNRADSRQIDYMKKVKQHFAAKNVISFMLIISCMWIEFCMNASYGIVEPNYYYGMIPVWMLISRFVLSDVAVKKKKSVWRMIAGGISLCLIGYCISLVFAIVHWVQTGSYPFGLNPVWIGPFVSTQLSVIGAVQGILFVVTMTLSLKTANSYSIPLYMNVIGANLALAFNNTLLRELSGMGLFKAHRNRILFIILAEGIVMAVILLILEKLKAKRKNEGALTGEHTI